MFDVQHSPITLFIWVGVINIVITNLKAILKSYRVGCSWIGLSVKFKTSDKSETFIQCRDPF